ncbi:MAG: sulfatase [Gammaproteobacteria bacterium]|nr:sulfatase [Gammaproteobacteria bacterium]
MSLRAFLIYLLFVPFLFIQTLQAKEQAPNIIIILADDLGVGDLSMNGSPIRTPNIDALAKQGAYLNNFYASANVCSPSRAGLLTGRYPIRMGMASSVIEPESTHGLPLSETTLAEMLKGYGYNNAIIGKWHLGHTKEHWPTSHGFDYYFGLPYSNDMKNVALYRNEKLIEQPVNQASLTQRYTKETTDFIVKNRKQPFFVYMSHTFPHIPLYASEKFKGKSSAGIYGDAVEELDWSVGEVIKTLKEHQLDKNTLIFFTSDNGAWFEGSNAGFRDMKGLTWEGAYRVPLIAWWPGKIKAGTVSNGISMNLDILPTVSSLVDSRPNDSILLDGRNIWSLLQGNNVSPHESLYLFNNEDITAVRTQNWKYLARAYYKNNYIAFENIKDKMGFAYELLFDMQADKPERYSQAENRPEVLQKMKSKLADGRQTFGSMRTAPEPKVFP